MPVVVMPPRSSAEQVVQSLSARGQMPFHPFSRNAGWLIWLIAQIGRGICGPSTEMAARRHRQMPKIIEFLGFDPMPEPTGLPARIAYARRRLGWTQKELARALKVDAVSIYRWEKGLSAPPAEAIHRLLAL